MRCATFLSVEIHRASFTSEFLVHDGVSLTHELPRVASTSKLCIARQVRQIRFAIRCRRRVSTWIETRTAVIRDCESATHAWHCVATLVDSHDNHAFVGRLDELFDVIQNEFPRRTTPLIMRECTDNHICCSGHAFVVCV